MYSLLTQVMLKLDTICNLCISRILQLRSRVKIKTDKRIRTCYKISSNPFICYFFVVNTRQAQQILSPERSKLSKSYKSVLRNGASQQNCIICIPRTEDTFKSLFFASPLWRKPSNNFFTLLRLGACGSSRLEACS